MHILSNKIMIINLNYTLTHKILKDMLNGLYNYNVIEYNRVNCLVRQKMKIHLSISILKFYFAILSTLNLFCMRDSG